MLVAHSVQGQRPGTVGLSATSTTHLDELGLLLVGGQALEHLRCGLALSKGQLVAAVACAALHPAAPLVRGVDGIGARRVGVRGGEEGTLGAGLVGARLRAGVAGHAAQPAGRSVAEGTGSVYADEMRVQRR